MSRFFRVGGAGAAPLILGLISGYPLGAASVIDMYQSREIGKDEAERLLAFCNNTGPAFIFGVAGGAIFRSPWAGLLLYVVHIVAAVTVGMISSIGRTRIAGVPPDTRRAIKAFRRLSASSVKSAVSSTLTICGFIVFFNVLVGVLDALGIFVSASGILSCRLGLPLGWVRSLLRAYWNWEAE
jgi:hypothetical protein